MPDPHDSQLQPCLKELLRTCVHPQSMLLRIEHVTFLDTADAIPSDSKASDARQQVNSNANHRHATKLVVTDGQLSIQALLHRKLAVLSEAGSIEVGDYVEVHQSQLKRAKKLEHPGNTVFLGINDCHFIKHEPSFLTTEHQELAESIRSKKRSANDNPDDEKRMIDELDTAKVDLFKEEGSSPFKRPRLSAKGDTPDKIVQDTPVVTQHNLIQLEKNEPSAEDGQNAAKQPLPLQQNIPLATDKNGTPANQNSRAGAKLAVDDEDDENAFETAAVNTETVVERRQVLKEFHRNTSWLKEPNEQQEHSNLDDLIKTEKAPETLPCELEGQLQLEVHEAHVNKVPTHQELDQQPKSTISRPVAITSDPPFHTLQDLRLQLAAGELPSRSYVLATLAFISWVGSSLIHRPGSPFPPKRHIRVEDPSVHRSHDPTLKQSTQVFYGAVTLAVYIDAAAFKPRGGTLALFRGVTMQKLTSGDIILNAYARLKDQSFVDASDAENQTLAGKEEGTQSGRWWYIDDLDKIRNLGYGREVDEYLRWSEERKTRTSK